jgi:hypothetical protein
LHYRNDISNGRSLTAAKCNEGNECTINTCDPATGKCSAWKKHALIITPVLLKRVIRQRGHFKESLRKRVINTVKCDYCEGVCSTHRDCMQGMVCVTDRNDGFVMGSCRGGFPPSQPQTGVLVQHQTISVFLLVDNSQVPP